MAFDVTLKDYLKEIDESPLLTWEEEKELARRIHEEDDPLARERMVCSNLRLVVSIAKRFSGRGMTLGDLIEEGNIGLLRAVDSFDPEHGVRFSTYAAWWIKQGIKRSLLMNAQPIHIPTYMVELVNQYRQVSEKLKDRLGRPAALKEMAAEMGLPLKKAKAVRDVVTMVDAGFQGDAATEDNSGLDETLKDDRIILPEDVLGSDEEIDKAIRMLGEIDEREARILTLRFGIGGQEPLTLKEIGKVLGLTRERVRQIQASGLAKLNELMAGQ